MAKKLRVGDSIRGYRVTKMFGPGMMAISYAAEGPSGTRVFLTQYKSPSPAVIWYPQFVEYQQELSRRVRDGKGARYAGRLVDAFEETWGGRTYFAVFELVANARDLDHMLEEEREIRVLRRRGALLLHESRRGDLAGRPGVQPVRQEVRGSVEHAARPAGPERDHPATPRTRRPATGPPPHSRAAGR